MQEIVSVPSSIGDLLADILATLDIELFPNDETTTKETYKQRFFQLINNSEVGIDLFHLLIDDFT